MTYWSDRRNAFFYSLSGLRQAFRKEPHIRIHFFCTMAVIALGFYFSVSAVEWIAILVCITLVVTLELVNTAIEQLCNLVMPDQHPVVKYIKDISAAAVLVACAFAIATALIIFLPRI